MHQGFCPASRYLANLDTDWANLIQYTGPCRLETHPNRQPYESLVRAVAHQQLHGRAAEAILQRFLDLFPNQSFPSPEQILQADAEQLRTCGFSANKVISIANIAQQTIDGVVPRLDEAQQLSDAELITKLTTLRGIGQWTVEILLMSSLERQDILPCHDFGIREGWRRLKNLPEQLTPAKMNGATQHLSPYRSTAAWYLWQLANSAKKGEERV